jgi:CRP-like cAMP-binding protein
LLEEEKGFCLVVDGLVQIFTKANSGHREEFQPAGLEGFEEDSEQERDASGYQLLTEVKNGAPMSSLFTILSLFTEDVTLKREDSGDDSTSRDGSYVAGNGFEEGESFNPARADRGGYQDARPYGAVPPMSLADEYQGEYFPATPEKPARPQRPKLKKSHSVHPDIIARASVDTTIAVIPASAFRRLTRVYPKASGHIVQVILTRFQRVTFLTAYSYLGLTSEVLRTEKLMSYYTNYQLPNDLRGAPLDNLKKRFDKERERLGPDEDESKGIALLKNDHKRRRSSATLRKEVAMHAKIAAMSKEEPVKLGGPVGMKKSYSGEGENASETVRLPFSHNAPPFSQGWTTSQPNGINLKISTSPTGYHPGLSEDLSKNEDSQFQKAVSDCLFKALGLNQRNGSVTQRTGIDSGDHSPRLVTYNKQKVMFSNAFGFIDPYEGSHDGDTESVASTGTGHHNNPGVHEELKRDVDIVFFPKGSVLVEQGERTPGIYYVIDGFLDVGVPVDEKAQDKNVMGGLDSTDMVQPDDLPPLTRTTTSGSTASGKRRKTTRKSLYMVKPGGVAGYMGSISAYRSFVDVRAQTDVYVGFVPASALERIVERNPVVLLTMAKRLTSLLPRLILHIDFALEWLQVSAGQVVYHQEEESDAIYIVLNGRMRAILEDKDDGVKVLGEYGQGESVGELEVLTETTRPATLHAIRDTELAKFPKTLFNSLALEHPGITIQISKIIASRMRSLVHGSSSEKSRRSSVGMAPSRKGNNVNLRTVCILPVTAGVPVTEFAHRLTSALHQTGVSGNVVMLNQATVLNHLGRHAFSRMGKLKLAGYLADLEEKYGMVLYVCDTNVNSPWTQTCIAQADEILLVALAEGETGMGEFERVLLKMGSTARKSLVLIHGERFCREGLTRRWLEVCCLLHPSRLNGSLTFTIESEVDQWRPSSYTNVLSTCS